MRIILIMSWLALSLPLIAGTFSEKIYLLQDHMRGGVVSPEMPGLLRGKRQWALEETGRMLAKGELLDFHQWVFPMRTLYGWSINMEWDCFETAARDCSFLLNLMRGIDDDNALAAANLASHVLGVFADAWMTTDAPGVIRIMDETEAWVLDLASRISGPMVPISPDGARRSSWPIKGTALPEAWYRRMTHVQANILNQEGQFPPERRPWLWQSRQKRLLAAALCEDLPFDVRTGYVAHWGEVLLLNGRGDEAERLLRGWMRRDGQPVSLHYFFRSLMQVLILDKADMDAAARLLAHADAIPPKDGDSFDIAMRRHTSELYYSHIVLPEYELRRRRHLREQERLERLRAADEKHAARAPRPKP